MTHTTLSTTLWVIALLLLIAGFISVMYYGFFIKDNLIKEDDDTISKAIEKSKILLQKRQEKKVEPEKIEKSKIPLQERQEKQVVLEKIDKDYILQILLKQNKKETYKILIQEGLEPNRALDLIKTVISENNLKWGGVKKNCYFFK